MGEVHDIAKKPLDIAVHLIRLTANEPEYASACSAALYYFDDTIVHTRVSISGNLSEHKKRRCLLHSLMFAAGFNISQVIDPTQYNDALFEQPHWPNDDILNRFWGRNTLAIMRNAVNSDAP